MNPTVWNFAPAAALVTMGALFAWFEKRSVAHHRFLSAALREYAASRSRRRIRIAALLVFVGTLMACGNLTNPREHPIQYVVIWSTTALLAISMLCYGIVDFISSRTMLLERTRRIGPEDAGKPRPGESASPPPRPGD